MSRIDDLIAKFCPKGVPFEPISVVVHHGSTVRWADVEGQEFQYIDLTSVNRVTHAITETQTITSENAPSRAQQIVHEGDVLFGTTRPMLKRYIVVPPEYDRQIASTGFCVLRPKQDRILANFLFHLLGTPNFYAFVEANERGASYPAIPDGVVKQFKIPVPPVEVQREIVRVLDLYGDYESELENKLQAEVDARRRQYVHYLHAILLDPRDANARWTTLGEIGRVAMCKRVFKNETTPVGEIPFYKIGTFGGSPDAFISHELYEGYKRRYSFPKKGDVLISAAGTIGRAIPYDGKPAYFQDSNIVWVDNDESLVTNRFLFYWYRVVKWSTDGGTIQRLYNDNLRRAKILIPSFAEQHRAVAFLDKFDALMNDIRIELPAELNARRKQYEHYRDRLLTFKELAA